MGDRLYGHCSSSVFQLKCETMCNCYSQVHCRRIRCFSHRRFSHRRECNGFTLLEILLTTVVLLMGLTAVFHTTRSALKRITLARELTEAQNACQAVLNDLLTRTTPIELNAGRTVEHLPNWKIRVDIYPASQPGLYVLHLSAQQFAEGGVSPDIRYQMLRWVPAERVKLPEPTETFFENRSEFDSLFP